MTYSDQHLKEDWNAFLSCALRCQHVTLNPLAPGIITLLFKEPSMEDFKLTVHINQRSAKLKIQLHEYGAASEISPFFALEILNKHIVPSPPYGYKNHSGQFKAAIQSAAL